MESNSCSLDLLVVIVNFGRGSDVLHIAKKAGIPYGCVLLGRGTIQSKLLDFFGIADIRKEIVLMPSTRSQVLATAKSLHKELHLEKPNHGIAFISTIDSLMGVPVDCLDTTNPQQRSETNQMYNAIFTIVERGLAEEVIDAATKAGARGGTIINARGSSDDDISTIFSIEIEAEKEIVLILAKKDTCTAITSAIRERINLEDDGTGILFVQPVSDTFGIY